MLDTARELGLKIVAVADTHAHADYISGGPGLSKALRIPYYLHSADAILPYDGSPAKIEFAPLADGQTLPLGSATIRVEHTPGHTAGERDVPPGRGRRAHRRLHLHRVGGPARSGRKGRGVDSGALAEPRARASLVAQGRSGVPGPLRVATPSGSRIGAWGGALAAIAASNAAFQIKRRDEFVSWVMQKIGKSPDAYRKIKAVNLGLIQVWDMEAQELDSGKNECARGPALSVGRIENNGGADGTRTRDLLRDRQAF